MITYAVNSVDLAIIPTSMLLYNSDDLTWYAVSAVVEDGVTTISIEATADVGEMETIKMWANDGNYYKVGVKTENGVVVFYIDDSVSYPTGDFTVYRLLVESLGEYVNFNLIVDGEIITYEIEQAA